MTRGSEFRVFAGAEAVRFMRVPRELSRSELAKLEEVAKQWGAKGLAYVVFGDDGEVRSPIAKFLSEAELERFRARRARRSLFAADAPEDGLAGARGAAPPPRPRARADRYRRVEGRTY